MYISIKQAITVWDELRDALAGHAHWGGNECCIYAYTLLPYTCDTNIKNQLPETKLAQAQAAETLVLLVKMFEQKYKHLKVKVSIDGLRPDKWLETLAPKFNYTSRAIISVQKIKNTK